jgi:dihydrofolate synthase/folylpolyglutamate synthase
VSERIRNVQQASAWLEGLINFERGSSYAAARLDLGPIRRLLARLGNPEKSLSIVHVAGSKGKGSTCLLAEAILTAAGERVGTFTSPHLESWSERFRIGGGEAEDHLLAEAVEGVRPHVEALRGDDPENAPTFFDATTASALLLFARAGVSRVLLEVGLGGRLDSTNAVEPAVTCVTPIELEHTEKLGKTIAAIAGEKAGILKPGVPCVVGHLTPEAEEVVMQRAEAVGAPLFRLAEEVKIRTLGLSERARQGVAPDALQAFTYQERDGFEVALGLRVLGRHQIDNACMALAALRRLNHWPDPLLADAARRGLGAVVLPGRLERIGDKPYLLVDSAHTPRSAASLRQALNTIPARRRHLVLSISRDKSAQAILASLVPNAQAIWLTRADPLRSMDPEALASLCRQLAPESELHRVEDPRAAVRAAYASLESDDLLCCTGSFYMAGIARGVLRTRAANPPA